MDDPTMVQLLKTNAEKMALEDRVKALEKAGGVLASIVLRLRYPYVSGPGAPTPDTDEDLANWYRLVETAS